MKLITLLAIALGVFFNPGNAQNVPLGSWRMHLPYNSSNSLAITPEKVYSSTGYSIMVYRKDDGSLLRLDKVNGLSDIGIDFISYSDENGVLFIAYSNSNIDLLFDDNSILNVPELRNPLILGDKTIRDVHFLNNIAYISTGIEIILYDLDQLEFITNFPIGNNGEKIGVNGIANDDNYIYAATDEGMKRVMIDDANISDFSQWEWMDYSNHKISRESVEHISSLGDSLFISVDDTIKFFDGSVWSNVLHDTSHQIRSMASSNGKIYAVQWELINGEFVDHRFVILRSDLSVEFIKVTGLSRPVLAKEENQNKLWISDLYTGLKLYDSEDLTTIKLQGPLSTGAFRLNSFEDKILVAAGGVEETFNNSFNVSGLFVFENGSWKNYFELYAQEFQYFYDVLDAEIDPIDESLYISSFLSGIAHIRDGNIEIIDTSDGLGTAVADQGRVKISDMEFDQQDNLWASSYNASKPFICIARTGEIFQFSSISNATNLKRITIDSYGQIWAPVRGNGDGIVVFNSNQTLENTNDDSYRRLTTASGLGEIKSAVVNCIVEDKNESLWVGTEQGIAIFDCPGFIFDPEGCEPRRVIVELDGFNAYLFETENVRAITVDGANRKWVGTTNGVWLISATGEEEIFHFNTENSPLPSNNVFSIAINGESGEIFIGTELGVVSYRGDATSGGETHENVKVFPNPVEPDYFGPIAISGLVDDAIVKITDISGILIYETPANGGQAIWNGSRLNGERAKSGVYMVFSSNEDGSEKFVAKILLLN